MKFLDQKQFGVPNLNYFVNIQKLSLVFEMNHRFWGFLRYIAGFIDNDEITSKDVIIPKLP